MNKQNLAGVEEVLGPEHPSTLVSMNNLARTLDVQGKSLESEPLHRKLLPRREKVLGPEHIDTLHTMWCLAHVLAHRRCFDESCALYERAYAAYVKTLGDDHPTTRACRERYDEMLAWRKDNRVTKSHNVLDFLRRLKG